MAGCAGWLTWSGFFAASPANVLFSMFENLCISASRFDDEVVGAGALPGADGVDAALGPADVKVQSSSNPLLGSPAETWEAGGLGLGMEADRSDGANDCCEAGGVAVRLVDDAAGAAEKNRSKSEAAEAGAGEEEDARGASAAAGGWEAEPG